MMTIDKQELRRLAGKATKGKWVRDGEYVNELGNVLYAYVAHGDEDGGVIAETNVNCRVKTAKECRANADFIAAANPAVVLELLDEIEALRKDAERYRWLRDSDTLEGDVFSSINEWLWGDSDFQEVSSTIDAAVQEAGQ